MKFGYSAVVAVAAFAAATFSATAFQPNAFRGSSMATVDASQSSLLILSSTSSTTGEQAPCAMPDDVIPESVTAKALRSAILTNADGKTIRLDEKMGPGTSIVIFLRHAG